MLQPYNGVACSDSMHVSVLQYAVNIVINDYDYDLKSAADQFWLLICCSDIVLT
jgi:hypothetical protein